MKEVIDIYTKFIIAVISFFSPLILHLLTVFLQGDKLITGYVKKKVLIYTNLKKISGDVEKEGGDSLEKLLINRDNLAKIQRYYLRLQFLIQPKVQIKDIFLRLFLSLSLLMIYFFFQDKIYDSEKKMDNGVFFLTRISLLSSLGLFVAGIYRLKEIAWAVIDVRKIVENGIEDEVITGEENTELIEKSLDVIEEVETKASTVVKSEDIIKRLLDIE